MHWTVRFVEEGRTDAPLFTTEMIAPLDLKKGRRLGPTPAGEDEVWLLVETRERVDTAAQCLVQDVVLRRRKPSWLERWYDRQDDTTQQLLAMVLLMSVLVPFVALSIFGFKAYGEGTLMAYVGATVRWAVPTGFVLLGVGCTALVMYRIEADILQRALGTGATALGLALALAWSLFAQPAKPPETWIWPADHAAYANDLLARTLTVWAMAGGALSWLAVLFGALRWTVLEKILSALLKK